MRIRYLDKEVTVDSSRPHATLGRSDDNDLVVKGNLISRLHARVEMSRDRFLLIDQSTNGSFVLTRKGEELFVRRDSIQISGEGVIGLGRIVQPSSAQAITFIQED
jgi:adenylate cyclase